MRYTLRWWAETERWRIRDIVEKEWYSENGVVMEYRLKEKAVQRAFVLNKIGPA